MPPAEATREVLWNATPAMVAFMYASMVVAVAVFAYGSWRRIRVWRLGLPEARWDRPWLRTRRVLVEALGQRGVLRERLPGLMHAFIFFSFLVLLAATTVVMLHHDFGIEIMRGGFYLWFQSLATNVFGVLALVGVGIALWRRYAARAPRLEHGHPADLAILIALGLILVTGFALSGLRIAATADPWAAWRPVGQAAGRALAALTHEPAALRRLHAGTWIFHVALWHAFLALIPFSKMFHLVTGTLGIYCGNLEVRGLVPTIDFDDPESAGTLGVRTAFDLTWKQLLDLDACTECGRCEAACPAYAEGKPLSPKRVILDVRGHVRSREKELLAAGQARRLGQVDAFAAAAAALPALAGGVIREETLWACTTCRACEAACPVAIEHVRLIVQLRQNLAMEQAAVPQGLADAVASLEARQHPFRGVPLDRAAWYRPLAPAAAEEDRP